MKILGIDTSGYANAVGIIDGIHTLADEVFATRADSLGQIITNIDAVLAKARLRLEDIDGFGIGLGPGSWTGIRIGVTVAKILAYSRDKPVAGISTLEALAYNHTGSPVQVCPIISVGTQDAVYAALYHRQGEKMIRLSDYYVGDIHGLAGIIKEPTVFVSAEENSYPEVIRRTLDAPEMEAGMVTGVPGGAVVARLAAERLECGDSDNPLALTPLYLKESTARAFVNRYAGNAPTGRTGKPSC
jgi:tRNA threonylcarbamoyladenosine biosynthesis protein TsaB